VRLTSSALVWRGRSLPARPCDSPHKLRSGGELVAVYLKSMVVVGPSPDSKLAAVAHPPIDRILLQNLAAAHGRGPHFKKWRLTAWTSLSEAEYYSLIADLRDVLATGEPL